MLRFTDAEYLSIEINLQDCKPRNKKEWRQAVAVGLSIGQGVERQCRARELLVELGRVCKACGAILPCPECGQPSTL